ncbi:hypothetical protein GCM10011584_05510 [Nocardioides phosphati]|uniref:Alkylmercury lyase n=1 Tax=Nocardioides phosphati TaxID=1867775 RepID=A0ABQ2N6X9_9ACTN|nr:alkylmercury lyase family protein [Nocardioides phosphati]GGO85469.1 hypothetical protein GCM10011584_05510 [Nocardioides phosphati]
MSALLEATGLPADKLLTQRNSLPEPLQLLHRRTLLALGQSGKPPTRAQLETWAIELHLDLDAALRHMAESELVFLDPAGREITGGVPFAPGPTAHQVRIVHGPTVSANCAIDALGIAAMLDRDVDVESLDPLTDEPVAASSRAGCWTWQPIEAVVFVGSSGQGRLTETCCPVINFFTSSDHALAYQSAHALDGFVLALSDAVEAGALVFGDLLRNQSARPDARQ